MGNERFNIGLFKITEHRHAQSLRIKGEILFRRISYFRNTSDKARRDPNEGLEHIIQPDSGASIEFTPTEASGEKRSFTIPSSDLAEPTKIFNQSDPFIACFYSFNETNLNCSDGKYIHPRAQDFGPSCATIFDTKHFFMMFKEWKQQHDVNAFKKRVKYYDLEQHSGHVGPWGKGIHFKDEHEYRLLIDADIEEARRLRSITEQVFPDDENSLLIRLGSLKDISDVIPTQGINSKVEIKRKD